MPSEAPLFLMYTSGTTAQPKGCQHSTGGYMSYVAGTSKYYQDIHPEDVYWCFADIGWITGHSYIVYGPLSVAATSVIYEGVPTYPDPGRPWRIAERLGVNIFHTAPTTIRMLRKAGPDEPQKYNYNFKHMTTVGEPIEPEVWRWYYEVVGKREAAVVDTWWQTETGGFIGTTLPALEPMKPGSCGPGALGIRPLILDEDGNEVEPGSGKAGNICISNPWPGFMQTVWGDPDRFIATYFAKYNKDPDSKDWRDWPYFTGDGAMQAKDGYFRIVGRVDDVINVAGHRLGTKELESAALTVEEVGEAAAVPAYDALKGRVPEVFVSLKPGYEGTADVEAKVKQATAEIIGPIARPGPRVGHQRPAEDPLRQDHAPGHRVDLKLHRRRRHDDAVQPRGGRGDTRAGPDGQGRRGHCAGGRAGPRDRRDQALRRGELAPEEAPSFRAPSRNPELWEGCATRTRCYDELH